MCFNLRLQSADNNFCCDLLNIPTVGKIYQEELLLKCLEEQMKSKCLKDLHLRLKKCRQGVTDADQELESEVTFDLCIEITCVSCLPSFPSFPRLTTLTWNMCIVWHHWLYRFQTLVSFVMVL